MSSDSAAKKDVDQIPCDLTEEEQKAMDYAYEQQQSQSEPKDMSYEEASRGYK